MDQLETLFDPAEPSWRLEIRVKLGGGPFDPVGYSTMLVRPDGSLVGLEVHKEGTAERWVAQGAELLEAAVNAYHDMINTETRSELRRAPNNKLR